MGHRCGRSVFSAGNADVMTPLKAPPPSMPAAAGTRCCDAHCCPPPCPPPATLLGVCPPQHATLTARRRGRRLSIDMAPASFPACGTRLVFSAGNADTMPPFKAPPPSMPAAAATRCCDAHCCPPPCPPPATLLGVCPPQPCNTCCPDGEEEEDACCSVGEQASASEAASEVVASFSDGVHSTGYTNAWQTIIHSAQSIVSVELHLSGEATLNVDVYLARNNTDSANPNDIFAGRPIHTSSNDVSIDGADAAWYSFDLDLAVSSGTFYIWLKGTGTASIQFQYSENPAQGGAGNHHGTLNHRAWGVS